MESNDPFQEFEFKPLTEGLGFHKKKTVPTPGMKASPFDLTEESDSPLKAPLPRRDMRNTPATTPAASPVSPVDEILQTLKQNRRLEIEEGRQQIQDIKNPKVKESWKPAVPSLSAAFLDAMLITAASLLCMIILLVVTRVDLLANLANPDTEGLVYLSTLSLFGCVTFIYMVIHRIFLGFTPGEWASDLRIGRPEQSTGALYAGKILLRQILVTATGLIVLPLISQLLHRDVAGQMTGAPLLRKA